jgi:hypothetical protein
VRSPVSGALPGDRGGAKNIGGDRLSGRQRVNVAAVRSDSPRLELERISALRTSLPVRRARPCRRVVRGGEDSRTKDGRRRAGSRFCAKGFGERASPVEWPPTGRRRLAQARSSPPSVTMRPRDAARRGGDAGGRVRARNACPVQWGSAAPQAGRWLIGSAYVLPSVERPPTAQRSSCSIRCASDELEQKTCSSHRR